MTKKELIDLMAEYPDDASVVIEVHDTALHEDLYGFTFDAISMHELRLTAINHNEK